MENDIRQQATSWVTAEHPQELEAAFFAETRDIFQTRLDRMLRDFLGDGIVSETDVYMLAAIAGEIGNNSFDHNVGSWPDTMGIFFGHASENGTPHIVLADRGQGILKTLQRVRSGLETDMEALKIAFTEKLSGRAPENRGNGLKFVKESVKERKMHLSFRSGGAQASLNDGMIIEETAIIHGCLAVLTLD